MNRNHFIVAALACMALTSGARGQETRSFPLKLKDERGNFVPFYQEMTTSVDQQIKVQGQDLKQSQKSTFWYEWTPIKEERVREGSEDVTRYTIKQKIEGLTMDIDISGNAIRYDSRKPDAGSGDGTPGLVEFFKNLTGTEFVATLGKGYRVEKVEGREAFIKKLGSSSQQMEALLKKALSDDAIKEMADPTYKLLTDEPKRVGDKWERKTKLNLGPIGSYDLTYKFTYVAPDATGPMKGFDKIEVETTIDYAPPKEGGDDGLLFKIKDGKLVSDAKGSKGAVYYNRQKMRVEDAAINVKLRGDLTVTIGGTDTKVELIQDQRTTIKTRDRSFVYPEKDPPAVVTNPPTNPPVLPVVVANCPCPVVVCERPRRIGLLGRLRCR